MNATKIKSLIAFCCLVLCSFFSLAQDMEGVREMKPGQLRSFGKNAFIQGDYSSAAMYYQSFIDSKPGNYKVAFQLAESYRLSKDYRNAEKAYLKAYQLNPKKNALALFHYATVLKTIGRFEKSDEYYAKFKKEYKGKDKSTYLKMIGNNTKAAAFVSNNLKNPLKVSIEYLDSTINTDHVEAAPVYLNDSTLIYSSLKTDQKYFFINPEDSSSNEPFRKIYLANRNQEKWEGGAEFPGPFNQEGVHTSNGAFSLDGKSFYFTRCKRNKKNKTICSIYVSTLNEGEWSEPVSLGNQVNLSGFTSTQPTVGIEATKSREIIYFVSDRDGGKGGMDIWYTSYDSKKQIFKTPLNAGAKLNTAGDEITPFFDAASRTLYFSSDGWQGMGGQDIFKSNGELKKWSTPENIGSPINSSYDDLYYVINRFNNETGVFVSNREIKGLLDTPKGCCDDIFAFQWLEKVELELNGTLYEEQDSSNVSMNKVPVKGAKIFLEQKNPDDSTYFPVNGIFTDANGKYSIALMPNREYRLITKKEGYLKTVYDLNTFDKKKSGVIEVDLDVKEAPLEAIALKNIYYEYGKATLTESAKNSIDTTLLIIMNNNQDLVIEISSHTDNIGSDEANELLSQNRAESVVNYLVSKGIDKKMLNAKGYGEKNPIAANQNPDGS
ncbi:MAG TPA: OmpA family protein, partial [Bacteroidia bacterium]|nr:OmpA family protein [Bacteroidia bacterium]